jgi:hypothetical protein
VLVLNTLVYYLKNDMVNENEHDDPLGQFAWLQAHLESSKSKKSKVLLVLHFAPGKYELDANYQSSLKFKYHKRFLGITSNYAEVVVGMLMAHVHVDTFRLYATKNCK